MLSRDDASAFWEVYKKMRLEWVNHASFVLHHGSVRLISDPWLSGTAFANSWDLLSRTRFQPEDFESITHIWISHEHPDHFSPATLRSIPEAARARITVLTQPTRDRRVLRFCVGLKFRDVVELPIGEWFELGPDVQVMCQPEKLDDSWLAVRAGDETLLNLNDCLVGMAEELLQIKQQVGHPVDVLLGQFSFASWIGNRDDEATHRRAARESRERILLQTRTIAPRWVIPFASFVWFCHEENTFMNAAANRVADIVAQLRLETSAVPIVMYPGDSWQLGSQHDPTPQALQRYKEDYASLPRRPMEKAQPRSETELQEMARKYCRGLLTFHGWPLRLASLLGRVPGTSIWLKDRSSAVLLSLRGLTRVDLSPADCDMAMTTDALASVLQNYWGGMTLVISGRFDVPSGGSLLLGGPPQRFGRYIRLADDVNHGWPLRREILFRLRNRLPGVKPIDHLKRHSPRRKGTSVAGQATSS
jgi:hypothetical protein